MNIKMVGADKNSILLEFLEVDMYGNGTVNIQLSLNRTDVTKLERLFRLAYKNNWK